MNLMKMKDFESWFIGFGSSNKKISMKLLTSCLVERFFSICDHLITRNRMKLMSEITEAQILTMANEKKS